MKLLLNTDYGSIAGEHEQVNQVMDWEWFTKKLVRISGTVCARTFNGISLWVPARNSNS